MNCDRCQNPSAGPRCPICVRTFGDALVSSRLVRVEPATGAQIHEDRSYGWQSDGES